MAGPFAPSFAFAESIEWMARVRAHGMLSANTGVVELRRRLHLSNKSLERAAAAGEYLRVVREHGRIPCRQP